MGKQPNTDQSQTNAFTKNKNNRLPENLVNPNGVYSAIARRNAMEDGAFFPEDSEKAVDKAPRGKRD